MESIFEKVKTAVNIAEVVEKYGVKLDRSGKGLCPFHAEKTPSFSVKKEEGIFCCFGCGEKGDAIKFVSKIKNIEPMAAARLIAEDFRVQIDDRRKVCQDKNHLPLNLKQTLSLTFKTVLKI